MVKINLEKFICSLLSDHSEGINIRSDIHKALQEQGLEYKDGAIVEMESKFKDGDILVNSDGRPFIFKGFLDKSHPEHPVAYCGIATVGTFRRSL